MSKFRPAEFYMATGGYALLPFRFSPFGDGTYVLSNLIGEYILMSSNDLRQFCDKKLNWQSRLYNDLKSKHFLIDEDSDVALDLLALKLRTKYQRLPEFTSLHMFVVTLRCEHSCPYCQVSRQSDDKFLYDMSIETAMKSLEMVFCSPSRNIKIEFQGGEPLLNFELIKKIVVAARAENQTHRKNLQFVTATNLALFDRDMAEFFAQHEILVSTSLDGPKELHNQNRPRPGHDSYQKTIQGIDLAREILGRDRVAAVMTTVDSSLKQAIPIIDEYVRLGFDSIFLRPLSPYGFAVKTKWYQSYTADAWLSFYFEGLGYIIDLNKKGLFFVEQLAATILAKILTPFDPGYVDLMSPAGAGIAAMVYNYDGQVYSSDEGRMLAEMGDQTFRLGNVHHQTYRELVFSEALLDPLEQSFSGSAPMCVDCAFEPWCGSDPTYHHATTGDFLGRKPTSAFCQRNMAIFKHLLKLMQDDREIHEIFMRWVNG